MVSEIQGFLGVFMESLSLAQVFIGDLLEVPSVMLGLKIFSSSHRLSEAFRV